MPELSLVNLQHDTDIGYLCVVLSAPEQEGKLQKC